MKRIDEVIPADDTLLWIGSIGLGECSDGTWWMRHENGEGMQVNRESLEYLLARFFADNF